MQILRAEREGHTLNIIFQLKNMGVGSCGIGFLIFLKIHFTYIVLTSFAPRSPIVERTSARRHIQMWHANTIIEALSFILFAWRAPVPTDSVRPESSGQGPVPNFAIHCETLNSTIQSHINSRLWIYVFKTRNTSNVQVLFQIQLRERRLVEKKDSKSN